MDTDTEIDTSFNLINIFVTKPDDHSVTPWLRFQRRTDLNGNKMQRVIFYAANKSGCSTSTHVQTCVTEFSINRIKMYK